MSKAGYVVLLGRPNVGKSTLLNRLLKQKISITSPKPQTTRHALLGIYTEGDNQIAFVDTPGLHLHEKRAINRYMNRAASSTLSYVDMVVWLIEAQRWTAEEQAILARLQEYNGPVIVAVNKIDQLDDKNKLLPFIEKLQQYRDFAAIIPISALKADNLEPLLENVIKLLPEAEFLFASDQVTTAGQRFLIAELIREKLVRLLRDELPYALTVEVESLKQEQQVLHIGAVIWVERAGQKGIVIGRKGALLKQVGEQARHDIEMIFEQKVYLQTWVKVRQGWSDDERALQNFGYQLDQ